MRNPEDLSGPERELERGLASLSPRGAGLDRAQISAEAACRGLRRRLSRWRIACAAMAALLLIAIGWRGRDPVVERVVYVAAPHVEREPEAPMKLPPAEPRPIVTGDYRRMCQDLVDRGLDALSGGGVASAGRREDLGIDPRDLGAAAQAQLRMVIP